MTNSSSHNSFAENTNAADATKIAPRRATSRINVLQLVSSFQQGGSERQAVQLTRLLMEDNRYRVHIACLDKGGALFDEIAALGFKDVPEFKLTSFYNRHALAQWQKFARYLRANRIDIVQTHDFYSNIFGIVGATLARTRGRIAARREITGWRTANQKRIERVVYRLSNAVIANAGAVKKQLLAEGVSAEKIHVVHNGMDLNRIPVLTDIDRTEVLRSYGETIPSEAKIVLIVANMHHPVKDHPTFLRAAQKVRASVPEAHFVLAGEGELMSDLKRQASDSGLSERAHFIGRCERVAELLNVSDVCVLSSTSEGFSNSILEYMAAARPVVVTDVGGAREAVMEGESGFIVAARDAETLAARITYLLENPERAKQMGAHGRQIVEQNFSLKAQLARTVAVYEKLLTADDARRARTEALMPSPSD